METDSDWDSLSGDGDIEPASFSVDPSPPKHEGKKETSTPPPLYSNLPSRNKSPLSRTNVEARAPPRTAEAYRNLIKGSGQGISSFRDNGEDFDPVSEKSARSKAKKTVQTSDKDETFLEIEIKEKMARESKDPKQSRQNERAALKGAIENLPYTEFQASDMSPRKGQDRSLTQTTVHNKPRQDYVVQSPRPVDTSRTSQGHSTDSNRKNNPLIRTTEETATKAKELELSYDDDYDDVIINNNAVVETPDERSADAGHFHGYVKEPNYKRGTNADNVFVMKSVYNEGQVEERYAYENAVRDYHSTYASKEAKMPLIADRIETGTQRWVQEFFGTLQILVDFLVIFIVEMARFLFRQFGRKLVGGLITVFGDSLLKPVLTALFNHIIQPMLILVWNMMHAVRKLVEPVFMMTREILSQFAMVLRAFRIVAWNRDDNEASPVKSV